MAYEKIDKPAHYQAASMEAIDVITEYDLNFALGSAVKYILRCGRKPDEPRLDDLRKALYYINHEIEQELKKLNADANMDAVLSVADAEVLSVADAEVLSVADAEVLSVADAASPTNGSLDLAGFKSDLRGLAAYTNNIVSNPTTLYFDQD